MSGAATQRPVTGRGSDATGHCDSTAEPESAATRNVQVREVSKAVPSNAVVAPAITVTSTVSPRTNGTAGEITRSWPATIAAKATSPREEATRTPLPPDAGVPLNET